MWRPPSRQLLPRHSLSRLCLSVLLACCLLLLPARATKAARAAKPEEAFELPCPLPLMYQGKGRSTGRSIVVTYQLVNPTLRNLENAVVRIGLPPTEAARIRKAGVFPSAKGVQQIRLNDAIYWMNVKLKARRKRKFSLKLQFLGCQSTTLTFDFLTYLVSGNGTSFCPSAQTSTQVHVQPKYYGKKHSCPTPSPTPAPTAPFSLFAEDERCLEARLAPFSPLRERELTLRWKPAAAKEKGQEKGQVHDQKIMEVGVYASPFATPYDCWFYCSVFGGAPVPFYFNWNVRTRDCYCCGNSCTLVYAPDFQVYLVTGVPYPFVRTQTVTSLSNTSPPPDDTWTTAFGSFNSVQSITTAPPGGSSPCALRQETSGEVSRATAGIYWEDVGMFNGMLLRDFVLNGFQLSYNFFVGNYGGETVHAPELRIQTRSPSTGRYSDFIWSPYNNLDTQGPLVNDAWNQNNIDQFTGSDASWPTGSTGGSGWSCTLGCYFLVNSTDSGNLAYPASVAAATFRDMETYVNGLLGATSSCDPQCPINDAIITGIQIVLTEPGIGNTWTAYTQDVHVAAGDYDWRWQFECPVVRRLREQMLIATSKETTAAG